MAVFSFPAIAIFDSTTIGRSLITAANQAAAQAAIGIDPADYAQLDADNTWTGDNTFDDADFSGVVKTEYVQGLQGSSSAAVWLRDTTAFGYLTASGAGSCLRWGGADLLSFKNIIPQFGTLYIGRDTARWREYYGIDGSFTGDLSVESSGSFKLFNLGDSHTNTTNTEFLKIFTQSNSFKIKPEITGSGTRREFILQTSYGNSHSNIRLDQYGLLRLRYYNTDHLMIGSGYTQVGVNMYPTTDNATLCGGITKRWSDVNSYDGSFSSDLSVETGGSFKFYNLGDSHTNTTNTEYLEMSWDTDVATIANRTTGTGGQRDLVIQSGMTNAELSLKGARVALYDGTNRMLNVDSSSVQIYGLLRPSHNDTRDNGSLTHRWRNTFSVDADISGTMKLSSYDDGAGNSGDVTTTPITSPTDSFWFDKNSVGTLSTGWVGLRTNYNTSGTAHSWIAVNNNSARLELGNGLRAVWSLSGSLHRLNMNFKPYVDNSYYNGMYNAIWTEVWQGAAKVRGSFVDNSNYGYLSIEPDGNVYLIKANSLGTTADAGIKIQTSQTSAAGNQSVVLDADYNGQVSFYFGGNNRGSWNKSVLQANVQVATNTNFVINRTWNNAATVFQGFDANITDTASDANSNLLNLKVSGVQKFRVKKDGTCTATAFVGNGSGLTGVPVDTGEDYLWTGDNEFDGDVIMVGSINFDNLPTSDPSVSGRLYNDSGTVKISSGAAPPP